MQTFYLWAADGSPVGSIQLDPVGALPERCTLTAPPAGDVRWIAGEWRPTPEDELDTLKAKLHQRATDMKWLKETGGIEVGGMPVMTAIEDQNRIDSAITGMALTQATEVDFKSAAGWIKITSQQMEMIAAAISTHVQACFTAERAHHEAIEALTSLEDAKAYDVSVNWP